MAKYSTELAEKIVNLIEEEFFTVSQVCKATGISRQTFYNWMDTKEDFRRDIELAMSRREVELMTMVQASLKRKLEGYYTVVEKDCYETDEITGEAIFKKKTITKKECPPDLRTIKMLLEREDKRKQEKALLKAEEKEQIKTIEEVIKNSIEKEGDYPPKKEFIKREVNTFVASKKGKDRKKKASIESIKRCIRVL